MGQLLDGQWTAENVLAQHDRRGLYFKRDSVFRNRISAKPAPSFPPSPADTTSTARSHARGRIAPR